MSRYVDGLPVATNLFEAAAWHKTVKVTCACGHSVTFDPHGLWWLFERKRWDMRLAQARRRFKCSNCAFDRRRPAPAVTLELTRGLAQVSLPMPPDREWKRALRRFRS